MMSEDYSEQWLEHFIDPNPKLDEVRNQNILDIVPNIKDYLMSRLVVFGCSPHMDTD